jgi:hypothetical protein
MTSQVVQTQIIKSYYYHDIFSKHGITTKANTRSKDSELCCDYLSCMYAILASNGYAGMIFISSDFC